MKSSRFLLVFILITLITSWFSVGFYNVDEHFQILEFGGYKARWVPEQNLSWEYGSAIRSSVEPYVVFFLIKALGACNSQNPFIIAFLLRLVTAALFITCFLLWRKQLKGISDSSRLLRWYDAALLLWFIPYLCVRSSSEIWGGCLFFISLALIYGKNETSTRNFLMAGAIAAFAFFIRFQAGFLIAGWLFSQILNPKRNFKNLLFYSVGFLLMSGVNIFLDHLFYHKWCLTPWNYFLENVIHARASVFSTEPAYYYVPQILGSALPLQGFIVMAAFIIFIIRKFRDDISLAVLFFVVAHLISPHKEIRFLFSLVFIFPFVFTISMAWFSGLRFSKTLLYKIFFYCTIITNLIMLAIVAIKPADTQVTLQHEISRMVNKDSSVLFYEHQNPYARVGVKMEFYKSKNLQLIPGYRLPALNLDTMKQRVFLVTNLNEYPPIKLDKRFQLQYQSIPQWLFRFDFNGWVSRTHVLQVYELKR